MPCKKKSNFYYWGLVNYSFFLFIFNLPLKITLCYMISLI
jgi:hypothetical protein